MPELPDLTVVAEELARRAAGREIAEATTPAPILLRATADEVASLAGSTLGVAEQRGKFLILPLLPRGSRRAAASRQPDARRSLLAAGRSGREGAGPDRTAPASSPMAASSDTSTARCSASSTSSRARDWTTFRAGRTWGPTRMIPSSRWRSFRRASAATRASSRTCSATSTSWPGSGTRTATRSCGPRSLAPLRRRSSLQPEDVDRLYHAMRSVLADATVRLRDLVPPHIETQHREFLAVHLRGGEPCPRCGKPLRQVGGNEATTFCRTCQPPF